MIQLCTTCSKKRAPSHDERLKIGAAFNLALPCGKPRAQRRYKPCGIPRPQSILDLHSLGEPMKFQSAKAKKGAHGQFIATYTKTISCNISMESAWQGNPNTLFSF